jgi:hypothetical protein
VNSPKKPLQSRVVDKPASNAWQGNEARPKAAGAARARAAARAKKAEPWEVTPESLACLDAVRSLLTALNNAYVSTSQIQKLILDIPVLAARCMRRVGSKQAPTPETLAPALTSMGNMGLENELLGLLEDMTTCRADLLEAEAAAAEEADPAG